MTLFIKILIFFLCYFTLRNLISDLKIFYLFSQRKTKHFAISAFKGSEISSSLKAASGTNPFNLAKCVLCSSLNVTENSSSFFHLKKWNDKPRTSTYPELIRGKPILIAYFLLLQFIPTRFLESYTRKNKTVRMFYDEKIVCWGRIQESRFQPWSYWITPFLQTTTKFLWISAFFSGK